MALDGRKPDSEIIATWAINNVLSPTDSVLVCSSMSSIHSGDAAAEISRCAKLLSDHVKGSCAFEKKLEASEDVRDALCDFCESEHPTLLVMGSGSSKLRRKILGSVSTYVVHHGKAPLAIVPVAGK